MKTNDQGGHAAGENTPTPLITAYQPSVQLLVPLVRSPGYRLPCWSFLSESVKPGSTAISVFLTLRPGSLGTAGTLSSPLRELTSNFPVSLQRGLLCLGLSEKF